MKKAVVLAIATLLLSSCENLKFLRICRVTLITNGHITCEEFSQSSTIDVPKNKDFVMHLALDYTHDVNATWEKEPTDFDEGKLTVPNMEYVLPIENIKVSVKGRQCDNAFTYQSDVRNLKILTIKKKYLQGKVEVNLTTQEIDRLNLFGYDLGEGLKNRDDLTVTFDSQYQKETKRIKTTHLNAYPVFEDDNIDVTFEITDKSHPPLPDNLWLRTNGRYALFDVDFTREYSDDKRKCRIKIPHFIVKDHGTFRNKEL